MSALKALIEQAGDLRNDDPKKIAKEIKNAMSGWDGIIPNWINTDEEALIDHLCRNSNATIQKARREYRKLTGSDLYEDILFHNTSIFESVIPGGFVEDNDFGELMGLLVLDGEPYGEP